MSQISDATGPVPHAGRTGELLMRRVRFVVGDSNPQAWKGDAMAEKLRKTPLLDELEKGPWPSFVTEIKKSAVSNKMANDELGILERSYSDKIGHWKHGGLVGVMGYGGGVIGRYSDLPEVFPEVAEFHTIRVSQPSGWFYTADVLRKLSDVW